jgi:putative transposase
MSLNDINSLLHTKWNCKYYIVFRAKISSQSLLRPKASRNWKNIAAVVRVEGRKDT